MMLMPAQYTTLTQEEMTYTDGGASAMTIAGAVGFAVLLNLYNIIQTVGWCRNYVNYVESHGGTVDSGRMVSEYFNAVNSTSISNRAFMGISAALGVLVVAFTAFSDDSENTTVR